MMETETGMEIKQLSFAADSPPLSVIVAAKVAAIALPTTTTTDSPSVPTFLFSNGYNLPLTLLSLYCIIFIVFY